MSPRVVAGNLKGVCRKELEVILMYRITCRAARCSLSFRLSSAFFLLFLLFFCFCFKEGEIGFSVAIFLLNSVFFLFVFYFFFCCFLSFCVNFPPLCVIFILLCFFLSFFLRSYVNITPIFYRFLYLSSCICYRRSYLYYLLGYFSNLYLFSITPYLFFFLFIC